MSEAPPDVGLTLEDARKTFEAMRRRAEEARQATAGLPVDLDAIRGKAPIGLDGEPDPALMADAACRRVATGAQLYVALDRLGKVAAWDAAVAAAKPATRAFWSGGYRALMIETNPKLARLAAAAGVDLAELFGAVE